MTLVIHQTQGTLNWCLKKAGVLKGFKNKKKNKNKKNGQGHGRPHSLTGFLSWVGLASGVSEGIQKLGRLWLELADEPGEDSAKQETTEPFTSKHDTLIYLSWKKLGWDVPVHYKCNVRCCFDSCGF